MSRFRSSLIVLALTIVASQGAETPAKPATMPLTGLTPAKVVPELCLYRYRVSTASAECQTYCDQAFGYYYSYVWMEAARNFETALTHDPDCAYAWLGLHRSLEKWGRGTTASANPMLSLFGAAAQTSLPERFTKTPRDYALDRAKDLMPKAGHREQLLIQSKLNEKGMLPGVGPEERKKKAIASLDELLMLYDDDEEGWFWRAQIAEGSNAAAPFYKALLRLNPYNPGANHEFVHFYEGARRPALGWPYAEGYIKSSPGIPHAFHMQAHLGMRIGKWQQTTDWSSRAIELQKAYHADAGVKPNDDHQFYHHLETLTRSLIHDGRFAEAKRNRMVAGAGEYDFKPEFFRMAVAEQDWKAANAIVNSYRKSDKANGAYHAAVVALERGDAATAAVEVDILRQAGQAKKGSRSPDARLWEVQGRLMCQTGQGEAGAKLIRRAVDKVKDDYYAHSWAGGAYYMEVWGSAALEAGLPAEADEAFQEALAHDPGSVRAALGLWALCRRVGRAEEADRFYKLATRLWAKADPRDFETMKRAFAKRAENVPNTTIAAAGD